LRFGGVKESGTLKEGEKGLLLSPSSSFFSGGTSPFCAGGEKRERERERGRMGEKRRRRN
jgi:hypothetical protein